MEFYNSLSNNFTVIKYKLVYEQDDCLSASDYFLVMFPDLKSMNMYDNVITDGNDG